MKKRQNWALTSGMQKEFTQSWTVSTVRRRGLCRTFDFPPICNSPSFSLMLVLLYSFHQQLLSALWKLICRPDDFPAYLKLMLSQITGQLYLIPAGNRSSWDKESEIKRLWETDKKGTVRDRKFYFYNPVVWSPWYDALYVCYTRCVIFKDIILNLTWRHKADTCEHYEHYSSKWHDPPPPKSMSGWDKGGRQKIITPFDLCPFQLLCQPH